MSSFIYPPIAITISGGATEAKQDDMIALLTTIDADTSNIAVDTSSIDSKITVCNTGAVTISSALPAGTNNIGDVDVVSSALPTGASTSALQTAANALLTTIDADTSSIDGKITTCNTGAVTISSALPAGTNNIGDVDIASSVLPTGASTSANQVTANNLLTTIDADTSSIDSKITVCNTGAVTISSALPAGTNNIGDVDVVSSALPTGASTSANQTTGNASLANIESDISDLNARLAGNLVPETFDYLALTYVAAGNGTGEIETVTYKTGGSGGSTVATLTLGYDGSDRLNAVTRT